jgi:hypothetical protein
LLALIGKMGSLSRHSRALAGLVIALVALFALTASSATGAREKRADEGCTWGASSIHAQIVDGRVIASTPVFTGCHPK